MKMIRQRALHCATTVHEERRKSQQQREAAPCGHIRTMDFSPRNYGDSLTNCGGWQTSTCQWKKALRYQLHHIPINI